MKPRPTKAELRRQAEERLGRKGPVGRGRTDAETARLVHELEVHEIELEMQNEELRQSHVELEALLVRFSELYDFAPVGYVTLDRNGVIRQANLEAARLLGIERSLLAGRSLHGFVVASGRGAFSDFLSLAFASSTKQCCEVTLERNKQKPVSARIDLLTSEDGESGRVVITDLTDIRRVESAARAAEAEKLTISERSRRALLSAAEDERAAAAALAESEAKANAMIKYAPTGIYELDLETGGFISVNDAMCRIVGYTREELLAVGPMAVFDRESRARFSDRVKRKLSARPAEETADYRVIKKDGSLIDLVLEITFNPNGNRALVVAHDVTERKQAERKLRETLAELERSNEDLEQYAYVASHDLQEPLRMVANYVELLRQRYQGQLDDKADKYIRYASNGAIRMQELVHDLLAYSRVGRQDLGIKPVSLGRVVQRAAENLAAAIGQGDARIESGPLPMVSGDETQLVQLFQNLIENAIKFRGKGLPVIRITDDTETRGPRDAAMVSISVSDNGIGIDPKHSDRVFRLFQRLHTQDEYPGTGIGLAVCKKIVERHGGTIRVEPAEGGGSLFRFTLPRQKEAGAETRRHGDTETQGRGERAKPEAEVEAKPEEPGTRNRKSRTRE